ncbi:arginine--tRNA ligase [uncultured Methanomethylovorans sp.]|uniref:arginine--tRNA ligase n=1 Tax=uncultured Methanomethylovorans sp. TaxID=183759 RepID=UPI002AA83CA5|nr:arginine--tRNA ligase [uncultured Methanomethylovorans sp.]
MYLNFRRQVETLLNETISQFGIEAADLDLEPSKHADMASKVAFRIASREKKNPKELAETIVKNANVKKFPLIGEMRAMGPYINISTSRNYIEETFSKIRSEGISFGGGFCEGKILLEHTSANPNGPLHVGHIRNSVIGDTLVRILRKAGYNVETQYYVNDMGRQIAIVSWALSHFDFDTSKKSDHSIADVYIKANVKLGEEPEKVAEIDKLMQLVEKGDDATIKSFNEAVSLALDGIKETLLRMNIYHDSFPYESTFVRSGDVTRIIEEIKATGHTKVDDGALMLDLEDYGFEKKLVVQRSDGTSLYSTRDLAYHEWKGERADRMIDILGADHKLISGQLKATLNLLGKPEPEVVIFEFVSLPEGSMSTRRGKFISADELLDQVEEQAFVEVDMRRPEMPVDFKQKVSRMVGIGAVRYDVIRVSPEKSTVFNWKEALDFEKQGAPFIQYSHARACSILKKAQEEEVWNESFDMDPSLLVENTEVELIKKMAAFDSIIEQCARELKPHTLAIYARELAESFNQFYRFVPVINIDDEKLRATRLGLVDCARITLAISLETLGIDAPESM